MESDSPCGPERCDRIAKGGKTGPPARLEQFGIADAFAGPAAFAVKVGLAGAGKWAVKVFREPGVDLRLGRRGAIAHVVDSAGDRLGKQMQNGARRIIAVDLIDPAHAVPFNNCFAGKESPHENGPSGTVKARQPCDESAQSQCNPFSLEQDPASLSVGFGFTRLIDPGPVDLRVDRGASRENQQSRFGRGQRVYQSIDQRIDSAPGGGERESSCDIQRANFVGFGGASRSGFLARAEAEHIPTAPEKEIGCGFAEEAAADDHDPMQALRVG